jgi:hypothetical protein
MYRSAWVTSSWAALQKRGLYDRYVSTIAPDDLKALKLAAVGSWIDAARVAQHYEACDRLGLSTDATLEMGVEVTDRVNAAALAVGRGFVELASLTPWSVLEHVDRFWARAAVGGAVTVAKLGPKEARVELHGLTVARIRYNRIASRGILRGMLGLFCRSIWAHELPALCTATTLGYHLQWT